ncbi:MULTISPECIES: MFS transporter [unclassified Corynebacterium]
MPYSLLLSLALLSATAAFATDVYLPVMPAIAAEFGVADAWVQLTLTAFFVGLAAGQLFIGPLSDALGRKTLLLLGAVGAVAASVLAALAPNIGVLIAARFLHGLGGGACVVLSRAVVPDLLVGKAAARAFSLLMAIQAIAPALAPIIGGLLAEPIGWRGIYWVLVGLHVVQLLLA